MISVKDIEKRIGGIEGFVRAKYPAPEDDEFYKAWGYEQWLIKKFGSSLDRLKVLHSTDYATFLFVALAEELGGTEEALAGRRLVRAKSILSGFFMARCPKDWYGVLIEEIEDGRYLCFMVTKKSALNPLLRVFTSQEVEVTDLTYESRDHIYDLCDPRKIAHPLGLDGQFFEIPGRGNFYAWDVAGVPSTRYRVELSEATESCKTKPKLKRPKKSTAKVEFFTLDEIADWLAIWGGWTDGRLKPTRNYLEGGE